MENKYVEENPGSSKPDLIIITPGECMELGLFQTIQNNGENAQTKESSEKSIASLRQKIRSRIEACTVQSGTVRSCESQIKQQKRSKPIILNSKIGGIGNRVSCTAVDKPSTTAEVKVANNEGNKKINERKACPCGPRKTCTLTPKVLNSGLNVQTSISNKKEEPIVLNPAVSKCPQDRSKSKHNVPLKTSNKTKPVILNSSVVPGNMGLTKSNRKLLKTNKSKPKILNSQVIKSVGTNSVVIPTENKSELKTQTTNTILKRDTFKINKSSNIQMKLEDTVPKEVSTYTQHKPSACTIVKRQKCSNSKIEINEESEEDATTSKITKNLEDRTSSTEALSNKVIKKEVNIINNTPVRFSIQELKDLVCKAKNSPKKCTETSFKHNKDMQLPLETVTDKRKLDKNDSSTTEVGSQLDLAQRNHNEDVIIQNIEGTQINVSKTENTTNMLGKESQKMLELCANNGTMDNIENEMKIKKTGTGKDIITSSEDKTEILNYTEVELQSTENKKTGLSNSLLMGTTKAVCDLRESEIKQGESSSEKNQPREGKEKLYENPKDVNDELVTIVPQKNRKTKSKHTYNKTDTNSVGDISNNKNKSSNPEHNMSVVLEVEDSDAVKKHSSKLTTNLKTTYNVENKESQSDGKHNMLLSTILKSVFDPEKNTQEPKEDKAEEIQSDNNTNEEEKITNEDLENQNEHVVHTEKNNKSISDTTHKSPRTHLVEDTKYLEATEGREINLKECQSEDLHQLSESEETITSASQITLDGTCNINEKEKCTVEVERAKEVNRYPEDQFFTEDKEAFETQTGIEHNQDVISTKTDTTKKNNIKSQEEHPPSELKVTPKKRGRKKKMVVQDNQSMVKENSRGERYKQKSVGVLKGHMKATVEETKTEDKSSAFHIGQKKSYKIEVIKQDGDHGDIKHNKQSIKLEESTTVTTESSVVKPEDDHLSPELISVPKKRGRKRKIKVEESDFTIKDNKLGDTDDNDSVESRKKQNKNKVEEMESSSRKLSNREKKMTNEDNKNVNIELLSPSEHKQYVIHTEKGIQVISDKVHKDPGTHLVEDTKDFDDTLLEDLKAATSRSQVTLETTCNTEEKEKPVEVDRHKAVNSYSEDPFKTKDKRALVCRAGIEHNQDIKSGEIDSMKMFNIKIQEHQPSELTPTPKKRGRKKKTTVQDNPSTVKQISEEKRYKEESISIPKGCMKDTVEEIRTEDDNEIHSQLKNSSGIGVLKQDADQDNIRHNEHVTKTEEGTTITAEDNEVKTEDEDPLSTALISVPKRRGRRKIIIKESNLTFKDSKLEEIDNKDVEKNTSNFIKDYTHLDEKSDVSNLDHPHSRSPTGDLSTTVTVKVESNSKYSSEGPLKNNSIDALIECKTPSISTDGKLLKKKGRPGKKTNLVETRDGNVSAELTDLNQENMITSTPLPKKRGRKRKSELSSVAAEATKAAQTTIEAVTFDEPLGKRKRKKINYFEMENNMIIEGDFDEKPKRRKMLPKNSPEINPKKLKTYSRNKTPVSILDVIDVEGNSSSKSCIKDIQEESDTTKSSAVKPNEENRSHATSELDNASNVKQETSDIEDSEANVSGKDKTEKKSKYRRTGETVLMMKSIFSAAVKNSSISDSAAEESSSGNTSSEFKSTDLTSTKRGRGRMKKSEEAKLIVIDEDNMVTCMSCYKKIDNSEWDIHNRKIHYNLGWREGEQALNLDDPTFIAQKVRPILKQDKTLICNKCERKNTSVKEFISHMEQCNGVVSSGGLITCAICKQEMEKSKWGFHKQRQHNNLTWRVGDRPLDLSDQNLVLSILNALYKARKPLYCEKCGTQKKSVVGFLSHRAQCGVHVEDAKVQCKLCDRKVLPVSMQAHIKLVHEAPKRKDNIGETSDYFDVELSAAPAKRKAAKTAMLIIDKFSKHKIVQDHTKHYVTQLDFNEGFVALVLKKELAEHQMIKCKFKDCAFETGEVKALLDHINLCERKPNEYYTCKKCLSTCDSESAIEEHVRTVHNIDLTEDDYKVDCDEEVIEEDHEIELHYRELRRRMWMEKKRSEKDASYKIKPACTFKFVKSPKHLFSHALYLTSEFCLEHFSKPLLFNHLRCLKKEWLLLDDDMVEKYLPRSGQSCAVARRLSSSFENVLKNEHTLKKFELFEVDTDEGITIFCGGPIHALAWLPTPYFSLNSNQILAVATANDFDEKYLVNVNYSVPSLIQFWDFGVLQNRTKMPQPKLMFGLAFDFGPVWYMEWCPSGCFDDEVNQNEDNMSRMGLLAVAGSNSMVYIYSVPFLEEEQMGLIYKVKPLLKLCLIPDNGGSLGNEKFYATKISWSMALGHRHMAVGYTNGMVGLFDLETSSKLLKCKDNDNVDVLLPYRAFQAHTHYISALNLVHLCGGNRWLLTASFDKDTYAWDLSNDSKMSSPKKHIITDGVWLTNWIAYVTTADESSTKYGLVHACIRAYRDYMYEHVNLITSPTTIMSLSSSNWLNSIIQGSSVGEVFALFPNQLVISVDAERSSKSTKYLLGCVKLIEKHKTPAERVAEEAETQKALKPNFKKKDNPDFQTTENSVYYKYEPITYEEADEKYGLLFCDRKMDSFNDFYKGTQETRNALKCQEMEVSRPNLYPLQAVNKIVYNPNRQASLYYATGYQVGFVRLTYLKFLENDPQIA